MIRKEANRLFASTALSVCLLICGGCNTRSEITLDQVKSDSAKLLSSYEFNRESDLVSRIKTIPDITLSMWKKWDNRESYTSYTPTAVEILMIERYISLLPPLLKRVSKDRLVAIYFVNDFLGSGATDFVLDHHDDIYVYAIFNPDTLKTSISEWVTYRESTCFDFSDDPTGASPPARITIDCGDEYTGFMYILLHEATHIADYIDNLTPYLHPGLKRWGLTKDQESTDFTSPVWQDFRKPIDRFDFDLRDKVSFYGLNDGQRLQADNGLSIYRDLSQSPFVSLYGSMNWGEDLAEFVTWYHFTTVLKQPYAINIHQKDVKRQTFHPMQFPEVRRRIQHITMFYEYGI